MAEKPRDACSSKAILWLEQMCGVGDFNCVGHLEATFLGWRVTFRTNSYELLDRGMAIIQLCRGKFSHKETL